MPDLTIAELLTVQQAIQVIDEVPVAPRVVSLPLAEADGLRLAEDLQADRDYPPFDKSLMDGYAVRCDDLVDGTAELLVIDTIAAGQTPTRAISAGETMAIMTGAPLPRGADGVVPVEDVAQRVPAGQRVHILRSTSPKRHIAERGSDCHRGSTVLYARTLMGPGAIGVAASIGASQIRCFARPRVAIISTGDEIVPIDQVAAGSQIRDSNSPMLASLLRRFGCEVASVSSVHDDADAIRQEINRAMSHDAVFITGGMSMGEFDHVPRILTELGVDLKITKLRIKPGKPFVFGTMNSPSSFVFGLPGNPVSAFVCTIRLASRLLTRMAGGAVEERWLNGRLDTELPANGSREFYLPVRHEYAPAQPRTHEEFATITPLAWKGSADLFTLAQASALLVRGENEPPIPKGTLVRVLAL